MKRIAVVLCLMALATASAVALPQGFKIIKELLTGFEEVPVVSTAGDGEFRARISTDESQIQYELSYSDLEGAVQQAHIHLGQAGVNGGITVFLCTNLGNGPAGTQPCPAPPATMALLRELQHDRLGLGEELRGVQAALAAYAGVLHPAAGQAHLTVIMTRPPVLGPRLLPAARGPPSAAARRCPSRPG